MKKLFNSPYFVGFMCVAALLYVGYTAMPFLLTNNESNDATSFDIPSEVMLDPFEESVLLGVDNNIDANTLQKIVVDWTTIPKRNPFVPYDTLAAQSTYYNNPEVLPNETAILAPFTQPALHAIIINNNIRLAMINNQVVAVGGTIDQFTIIGIESAHIDIDGPTGAKRLSLHTSNNEN